MRWRWRSEPRRSSWVVAVAFAPVWLALGVGNLGSGEPVFGWVQIALAGAWAAVAVHEWRRWRASQREQGDAAGR